MAKGQVRDPEDDEEKSLRKERENSQMKVYLLVAAVICVSWTLGLLGFSFLWIFVLVFFTFVIWYTKVINIVELYIREREISLHRRRALRQNESAEWLNFILNRWWNFSSHSIQDLVKKKFNPLLPDIIPSFVEHIELTHFNMGKNTPFIKYIKAFDFTEGCKNPATWSNVASPPDDLYTRVHYSVVGEMDVGVYCPELQMIFRIRLASLGIVTDAAVSDLSLSGKLQVTLNLNMDMSFPHIRSVAISFLEQPEVTFQVQVLRSLQLMEIPMLKSWLYTVVQDTLAKALVDPQNVELFMEQSGPSSVPNKAKSQARAEGILLVYLSGINERLRDIDENKEYEYIDEMRYCQLTVGDEKKHTEHLSHYGPWDDVCAFLISDIRKQNLRIKCKSKVLLSLQTLTTFDVALSSYIPQDTESVVKKSFPLAQAVKRGKIATSVNLECGLEYTPLLSVDTISQNDVTFDGLVPAGVAVQRGQVAGVIYIGIHSATGLLGLDPNGFSDPYCIVYCNGKKVLTTHYVPTTKNPTWEVCAETMVPDYTKAMLTFLVYDWDGVATSQDDFLGAAHYTIKEDEPALFRHRLMLGHNVLNQDAPDSSLGSIYVTMVFRPVDSVAIAEAAEQTKVANMLKKERQQLVKATAESGANGSLIEAIGLAFVDLTIYQAKELHAADRGGTSDPYCRILVNGKKKYTTAVISKNLNPLWEEKVRLNLPQKEDATITVEVFDKDVLSRDERLGKVTFTKSNLKKYSREGQSWFRLEDADSGWIQIFIAEPQTDDNPENWTISEAPEQNLELPDDIIITPTEVFHPTGDMPPPSKRSRFPSFGLRRRKKASDESSIASRDSDFSRVASYTSASSLAASEKFVGVQGKILRIRGITPQSPNMYCKLRLDNRNKEKRNRKFSHGQVLAKSPLMNPSSSSSFGFSFEVDYGLGVAKEALLVFDIKSSNKAHVATKGYILEDLFQDQQEITQWVILENGIELEVYFSQNNATTIPKSKLGSIINRFRRSSARYQ